MPTQSQGCATSHQQTRKPAILVAPSWQAWRAQSQEGEFPKDDSTRQRDELRTLSTHAQEDPDPGRSRPRRMGHSVRDSRAEPSADQAQRIRQRGPSPHGGLVESLQAPCLVRRPRPHGHVLRPDRRGVRRRGRDDRRSRRPPAPVQPEARGRGLSRRAE